MIRKIGILTSGGDSPGMNAAVVSVARCAAAHGIQLMGIKRGYNGLLGLSDNPMDDITALDIETILDTYGDQIVISGGYDFNGRPGNENTPVEEILAEVQRCFDTYPKHGSYMFMGSVLTTSMETTMSKMMPLIKKSMELARTTPAVHRPAK